MDSGLFRLGLALLALAVVLMGVGLISSRAGGILTWFGQLPGDIRVDGEGYRLRIPITSSLIVSVVLTVLFNIFRRR